MKLLASNFFLLFENAVDPSLVRPDLLVAARQLLDLPVPGEGGVPHLGLTGHRGFDLSPERPAQRRRHRVTNLLEPFSPCPVENVTVGKPLDPRLLPH